MMSLEISVGQCDPSALELYELSQLLVTTRSNSPGKKEMMMLQAIKMNWTMPLKFNASAHRCGKRGRRETHSMMKKPTTKSSK